MISLQTYLEDTYGDDVRFVYRHLPLISPRPPSVDDSTKEKIMSSLTEEQLHSIYAGEITNWSEVDGPDEPIQLFHDKARITAEAAEAAGAQGKFWEMYELLYERQMEWAALSAEDAVIIPKLVEYATELELDTARFQQELADHIYREKIVTDYEAFGEYGRMATPTFAVNNVFVSANEVEAVINLIFLQDRMYYAPPPQVIDTDKDYTATIRTARGDIVIELYTKRAPVNINNFAFLAQEGWYDGTTFYMVFPGTATQAGDPTNTGAGYPGYICTAEIIPEYTFNQAGLVGLAPSGQFVITYDALSQLDSEVTIIGKVIQGMEVAESLTPRDPSQGLVLPSGDVIETVIIQEK